MLKLDNIVKVYETGGENVTALRGVSLSFRENEFVAILGHSGCGKTTLLNIVGGLDQYTSGDLIINGRSTKEFRDGDWDAYRNHSIGFVFQSYNLIPHQSVLANVELALTLSGVGKAQRRRRAAEALEKVGLADQIHKRPNQLSGGQKQRVAIAGVIAMEPKVLILDEPTAGLDPEGVESILGNIQAYHQAHNAAIILVSHSMEEVAREAGRLVVIHRGTIPFSGSPEAVFAHGDELEAMGLGVPAMTRVFARLRSMGVDIPPSVYTIPQAREAVLAALHRGLHKAENGGRQAASDEKGAE